MTSKVTTMTPCYLEDIVVAEDESNNWLKLSFVFSDMTQYSLVLAQPTPVGELCEYLKATSEQIMELKKDVEKSYLH